MSVTPKAPEPGPDAAAQPAAADPDPDEVTLPGSAPTVPLSLTAATPAGVRDRQPEEPAPAAEPPVVDRERAPAEPVPAAPTLAAAGTESAGAAAAPAEATRTEPGRPARRRTAARTARRPARTRAGSVGVTLVLIAAGLLFTTSANTARGTQLRSERADLADLIKAEDLRVQTRTERVTTLDNEVKRGIADNLANNQAVESLEARSADIVTAAGLYPVRGPGLTVTLDDAPRDGTVPARVSPDDLVVHQQDVQAVVNALWAGGAEAMMLQDQRVISTSAVRCVGNTLILQGRVYSPPYTITAIGDVKKMQNALDSSSQIAYYLEYVASLRLGWSVKTADRIKMPAYAGSLTLGHARVAGSPGKASSSGSAGASSSP
jgi:uncharacterized protein YlxW (UPF0749 family)